MKDKKKFIYLIVLIVIFGIAFIANNYTVGSSIPAENIAVINVAVSSDFVNINACFPVPADKNLVYMYSKHYMVEGELHITVYTAFAKYRQYDPSPFDIDIKGDFEELHTIYLEDSSEGGYIIWSRDPEDTI